MVVSKEEELKTKDEDSECNDLLELWVDIPQPDLLIENKIYISPNSKIVKSWKKPIFSDQKLIIEQSINHNMNTECENLDCQTWRSNRIL